ncbi:unnamed protein product [Pedinophyceae sp. YPF-701]|nr:unnamed protein product [Pedinophyceae sp. YPF-701]
MGRGAVQYVLLSTLMGAGVVAHAFHTRHQFFPAMVYLSTSKIAITVLANAALSYAYGLFLLAVRVFFVSLRDDEAERVSERTRNAVIETCLALTVFREEFGLTTVGMFGFLLVAKIMHWLLHDRVAFLDTAPTVPAATHVRIVSLLSLLLWVDAMMLESGVQSIVTKGASVVILFAFEYAILLVQAASTGLRYAFAAANQHAQGRWEGRSLCVLYLDLISELINLVLYAAFFVIVFASYGLPVHLVRALYISFLSFQRRLKRFMSYRQLTAAMDSRFADATQEDMDRCDGTCIICRDEMSAGPGAKKLGCGHCYHLRCLRSWLEQQQTCPICRAPIEARPRPAQPARAPPREGAEAAEGAEAGGQRSRCRSRRRRRCPAGAGDVARPDASGLRRRVHAGAPGDAPQAAEGGVAGAGGSAGTVERSPSSAREAAREAALRRLAAAQQAAAEAAPAAPTEAAGGATSTTVPGLTPVMSASSMTFAGGPPHTPPSLPAAFAHPQQPSPAMAQAHAHAHAQPPHLPAGSVGYLPMTWSVPGMPMMTSVPMLRWAPPTEDRAEGPTRQPPPAMLAIPSFHIPGMIAPFPTLPVGAYGQYSQGFAAGAPPMPAMPDTAHAADGSEQRGSAGADSSSQSGGAPRYTPFAHPFIGSPFVASIVHLHQLQMPGAVAPAGAAGQGGGAAAGSAVPAPSTVDARSSPSTAGPAGTEASPQPREPSPTPPPVSAPTSLVHVQPLAMAYVPAQPAVSQGDHQMAAQAAYEAGSLVASAMLGSRGTGHSRSSDAEAGPSGAGASQQEAETDGQTQEGRKAHHAALVAATATAAAMMGQPLEQFLKQHADLKPKHEEALRCMAASQNDGEASSAREGQPGASAGEQTTTVEVGGASADTGRVENGGAGDGAAEVEPEKAGEERGEGDDAAGRTEA